MKFILNLFEWILKGVIFGILPFLVFVLITSRSPVILGIRSFVTLTGSMQPTIPVGSVIFTQSFPKYRGGDIIAFKSGNVNVTHRVIDVETKDNKLFYKTQGDANNTADNQLVPQENVIGKGFYHLPYLGRLVVFLKTIPGFFIFIVLPALIYIILEIGNIKKEMTKEIEKKLKQQMQPV